MDLPPYAGLATVAALLLANGFFVAAEFGIVAARKSRLEQLAAEGNAGARAAGQLLEHLNTYIAACQVGITLASLVLGWIGEPAIAHLVEPLLAALVGRVAPAAAHGVAIAISLTLITALHIVVGEQAPKGLALQYPEATTLFAARPLRLFALVFRWPTALLQAITNALLRLLGLEPSSGHEVVHSVEELRLLVTGSRQAGVVEESEARIATRALSFADLTAGALMTPRTELDALPLDLSPSALFARLAAATHHHLPVYDTTLDRIAGVLHALDYVRALAHHLPSAALAPLPAVRDLLEPLMVVPASKPADDLLDEMRTTGRRIAAVIDEYGGTAGIITLDDLMEALVGPIHPESTAAVDGKPMPAGPILAQPDGSFLIDGLTRLDQWEEITGLRLDADDRSGVETVGGLVMSRLGRIPEPGDSLSIAGRTLIVEALTGKRIAHLRLLPAAGASAA